MNNFTSFIVESRKTYDSDKILSSEINNYLNKVNKNIPQNVKDVIYLTKKYNLLDSESVNDILVSSKSSLKKLAEKYNINFSEIEELWNMLKDIKKNIRMLPQFQSKTEREMIELGKLSMDDLTIDLTTSSGRNAAAKIYMPMVYKIVNQYVGRSRLSKQELISAALQGLTDAMNNWKKDGDKKVVFKTYAAYRIKQQILNDINSYSHDLSGTSWYTAKKGVENLDAFSIDSITNGDDDIDSDNLGFLGIIDDENKSDKDNEDKNWNSIYKLIESHFKQRDVDIFYRYFGLNGYKREKSKDIAKSMGMSEGNIRNSIINKIIMFLRNDRRVSQVLVNIQNAYNESLMIELFDMDKQYILETLINDDIFILLEELNKWSNINIFNSSINTIVSKLADTEKDVLLKILSGDFNTIDDNFKKNKKLIILFLGSLYPTENMNKKSDVSLIDYMYEIQQHYKKYNKL